MGIFFGVCVTVLTVASHKIAQILRMLQRSFIHQVEIQQTNMLMYISQLIISTELIYLKSLYFCSELHNLQSRSSKEKQKEEYSDISSTTCY